MLTSLELKRPALRTKVNGEVFCSHSLAKYVDTKTGLLCLMTALGDTIRIFLQNCGSFLIP